MPHDQPRRAQLGRQELLEPQRGRITSAGELRHEHDPARLHQLDQLLQLGQVIGQGERAGKTTGLPAAQARAIGCSPNHCRDRT